MPASKELLGLVTFSKSKLYFFLSFFFLVLDMSSLDFAFSKPVMARYCLKTSNQSEKFRRQICVRLFHPKLKKTMNMFYTEGPNQPHPKPSLFII